MHDERARARRGFAGSVSQGYSSWSRLRRLRVAPYVATEQNTTALAHARSSSMSANNTNNAAPAQGDVVINMASLNGDGKKEKKTDTLFGPNIGIVSAGPDWAASEETLRGVGTGNAGKDELTPDIVKEWVERSKEVCRYSVPISILTPCRESSSLGELCSHDTLFVYRVC